MTRQQWQSHWSSPQVHHTALCCFSPMHARCHLTEVRVSALRPRIPRRDYSCLQAHCTVHCHSCPKHLSTRLARAPLRGTRHRQSRQYGRDHDVRRTGSWGSLPTQGLQTRIPGILKVQVLSWELGHTPWHSKLQRGRTLSQLWRFSYIAVYGRVLSFLRT